MQRRTARPSAEEAGEAPSFVEERKVITVMFADVKGSTEMIDNADPEHAQAVLDSVLEIMVEAVNRHQGTVSQVLGDGILALFGAPVAQEDHATRACLAALDMQYKLEATRLQRRERVGVDVAVRVGLNSGEVLMSPARNGLNSHYRPLGVTTHLAARLEQLAKPGSVLISGSTMHLVDGLFDVVARPPTEIKGVKEPVLLYELIGVAAEGTRLKASLARGNTPHVGREQEFEQLDGLLADVIARRGQAVGIRGDAGIGKSRLCHELIRSLRSREISVWQLAALAHRSSIALYPLASVLRNGMRISSRDDEITIRAKLEQALMELDPALILHAAPLLALLDVAKPSPEWEGLQLPQRRHDIFDALYAVMAANARQLPLILLFEDIQMLDSASRDFLDSTVERLADKPILLIMTYRPDLLHDWASHSHFTELGLKALNLDETEILCNHLIGGSQELQAVRALLLDRSQGNPFFLEEMFNSLVEDGSLTGTPGDYRLGRPGLKVKTPATLHAVIAARVDRLPASAKELLQAAAVIGETMSVELLRAVAATSDEQFQRDQAALYDAGMLLPRQALTGPQLAFSHALIQEVIAGSLARSRRTLLNGNVIKAMQSLYGERLEDYSEVLAEHALRGEYWDEAVQYLLQACSRATVRSANSEAITAFEKGLQAAGNLTDPKLKAEAMVDLRLGALGALIPDGHLPRIIEVLHEAEKIASDAGDARRVAAVTLQLSSVLWMAGNHILGLAAAERSLAAALQEEANHFAQIAAYHQVGILLHALGRYPAAIRILRLLLDEYAAEVEGTRLLRGWPVLPSISVRGFLSSSLMHLGEFAAAEIVVHEIERISAELKHAHSQAVADSASGNLLLCRGDTAGAVKVFSHALVVCRDNDLQAVYAAAAADLGLALARNNEPERAIGLVEDALRRETYLLGGRHTEYSLLYSLGCAMLVARRHDAAREAAGGAEALARSTGEAGNLAYALKLGADIEAAAGDVPEGVEARYVDAISHAEILGMLPLEQECRADLADYLARHDWPLVGAGKADRPEAPGAV